MGATIEREYIEVKLIGWLENLSTEFHLLSNNYKNIEENVKKLHDIGRDTSDTNKVMTEFSKNSVAIQNCWKNIENSMTAIVTFKNQLGDIHQQTLNKSNDIINKLDQFIPLFDNDFFKNQIKLRDYETVSKDLNPVIKLSKFLITPVGIISFLLTFTLGVFATGVGMYKIFDLFAPQKIEQKNIESFEESVKRLETLLLEGGGIRPPPSSNRR